MKLPPSGSLHDFGPLVLGEEPLHPQQHLALRRIVHRVVEKLRPYPRLFHLLQHQPLVDGLSGQAVRGVKNHQIHLFCSQGIPQPVQPGPVQGGAGIAFIDILGDENIPSLLDVGPQGFQAAEDGLLPLLKIGANHGVDGGSNI